MRMYAKKIIHTCVSVDHVQHHSHVHICPGDELLANTEGASEKNLDFSVLEGILGLSEMQSGRKQAVFPKPSQNNAHTNAFFFARTPLQWKNSVSASAEGASEENLGFSSLKFWKNDQIH